MRLLELVADLHIIERQNLGAILIEPGAEGYSVRFSIDITLPLGINPDLPPGVTLGGFERYPAIKRVATWRVPIWGQILELLNDPQLSRPENLGTMQAVERSRGDGEAKKIWNITTHGLARSDERIEYVRSRHAR